MVQALTMEELHEPVHKHMRTDFVQLGQDLTVAQALDAILESQPSGRIIYFYVADNDGKLAGVMPTRKLLMSPRDSKLADVMIKPVIALPHDASVLDAVLRQRDSGKFDVETNLHDADGFQQRLQCGQRLSCLDLIRRKPGIEQSGAAAGLPVAERDIGGIVGRHPQRKAGNLRLHRIDRIRHRIDREMTGVCGPRST